jgi:hypothetical protein
MLGQCQGGGQGFPGKADRGLLKLHTRPEKFVFGAGDRLLKRDVRLFQAGF